MAHVYSHLYDLPCTGLRLFTVYGPRQRPDLAIHKFARIFRDDGEIQMFGDGSTCRDYTYVADTVSGVLGAIEWVSQREGVYDIFNLGNHQTVELRDMIQTVGDEMGVEPRIRRLPMQPGDVVRTYADIGRARRELGYRPDTQFRVGVQRFLEWFSLQHS